MKNFLNFFVVMVALVTVSLVSKGASVAKQLHVVQFVNLNTYINNVVYKQKDWPEGTVTGTVSVDAQYGTVTFGFNGDYIPAGCFWDLDDSYTSFAAVTSHDTGIGSAGSITFDPIILSPGTHNLSIKYYDDNDYMEFYALQHYFLVYN